MSAARLTKIVFTRSNTRQTEQKRAKLPPKKSRLRGTVPAESRSVVTVHHSKGSLSRFDGGPNSGALVPFPSPANTLTYEPYFGLTEKPFSLNADSRFIFRSPSYVDASERLLGGIRRREGLLVLTGEIGTGKTTLCRHVLQQLGRSY